MNRYDKYLGAVWVRYGLVGVLVVLVVLAGLAWVFGVDVAGLLGLPTR